MIGLLKRWRDVMISNSCSRGRLSNIANPAIEIRKEIAKRPTVKAVIFDFDGTISTLRHGWEDIMESFMVEMITGPGQADESLVQEVKTYINESTGIQTIYQMQWLEDEVRRRGLHTNIQDAWWYKSEYNKRLLNMVNTRVKDLKDKKKVPEDFLIKGAREFIHYLHSQGLALYVASGTDHGDVVRELTALGLHNYFTEIVGAREREIACSKEAVLRLLMETKGLKGEELLVIGDGKVEIALGIDVGALTLGVASDEIKREGINSSKRHRLIMAGVDIIVGDFLCRHDLYPLLVKPKKDYMCSLRD
jgi:phosphoglycolate phosphatase-like HAD superfamily hydrolase